MRKLTTLTGITQELSYLLRKGISFPYEAVYSHEKMEHKE